MIAYAEIIESTRFQEILVDERRIREWRANKSNIEGLLGAVKGKQRSRLSGGGRKPLSVKLEEVMLEWVESRRARGLQVSKTLTASRGWLSKFMKRNGFSLRRKTSVAQQDQHE